MQRRGWSFVLLGLFLLTGCMALKMETNQAGKEVEKKAVTPEKETYRCFFTRDSIKIDGVINEPVWQKAKVLHFFIPVTFKEPIDKTEARLLYDKKYLYVSFKAYDQDIRSLLIERDSSTSLEDCLEVFFKTDPAKDPYFNFEINALGTVKDAINTKSGTVQKADWNCQGLKTGIRIHGTLNNSQDKDEFWTMEVAIPFAEVPTLSGQAPRKGDVWLFHLARCDYSVYLPVEPELTSCAFFSRVNFHHYEDWLNLRFD